VHGNELEGQAAARENCPGAANEHAIASIIAQKWCADQKSLWPTMPWHNAMAAPE